MVTRVWGRADKFHLVFSLVDALWEAAVPADLEDGQYAVELYCEDDSGNRAYWTGMLYLCNSQAVRVRIEADKFRVWLNADIEVTLWSESDVFFEPDRVTLQVETANHLCWG